LEEFKAETVGLRVSIPLWCDCDDSKVRCPKCHENFNPTMVRLRLMEEIRWAVGELGFQSHYGAIATSQSGLGGKSRGGCFNPTMVRLRRGRGAGVCTTTPGFNPTMVRLRPHPLLCGRGVPFISIPLWCDCDPPIFTLKCGEVLNFNPTMVRLRLGWDALTIERSLVSIPLWCDCDHGAGDLDRMSGRISIPLWCDCDYVVKRIALLKCDPFNPTMVRLRLPEVNRAYDTNIVILSIPLWCDCDPLNLLPATMLRLPFNPTMVRLRLPHLHFSWPPLTNFQSHYGAIATIYTNYPWQQSWRLSIPLWCDCDWFSMFGIGVTCILSIPLWCDCDQGDIKLLRCLA